MASIELRDYQRDAIDKTYEYWAQGKGDHPLIVAPTGAGKSMILAKLIEDATAYPNTQVIVLTHVKELIEQDYSATMRLCSDLDAGIYSAGLGRRDLHNKVIFAGIQSIYEKAPLLVPAPALVIVDECHLIPRKTNTRYGRFLDEIQQCNHNVKIVGLTATPYRLDSGYLHKGPSALFDGISYEIPVGLLIERGFLVPPVSKRGVQSIDTSGVHKRGGEWIESELAIAASDPELVRACVSEIVDLGQDRQAWLVFACNVAHAELLKQEFEHHCIPVDMVVGTDSKADRDAKFDAFRSGRIRCLVNVGIATTGVDIPRIDLVALVRATESTALYQQMVGRGMRPFEGKEDCLLLDYGNNVLTHGPIDNVRVKETGGGDGNGEAPAKACPECDGLLHAAVLICPYCDFEFPPPELSHNPTAFGGAVLESQIKAEWLDVDLVEYRRWQKEGKPDSVRVTYHCGLTTVNEWLCPDHGGYAASRYHARMPVLGAEAKTTADALKEVSKWNEPGRIKVKPNGRFHDILQLDYQYEKPALEDEEYAIGL